MNSATHLLAIFGLGTPELIIIFVVILLLFGGAKLPSLARGLGQSIREFKKASETDKDDDSDDEDEKPSKSEKSEKRKSSEKANGSN